MRSPCFYKLLWCKGIVSLLIYTSFISFGMEWPIQKILEFLIVFLCAITISYGICWGYYRFVQKEKQCFRFRILIKKKFYLLLKKTGIALVVIFLASGMYILDFSWKEIVKIIAALMIIVYLTYGNLVFFHDLWLKKQA